MKWLIKSQVTSLKSSLKVVQVVVAALIPAGHITCRSRGQVTIRMQLRVNGSNMQRHTSIQHQQ